MWYEAIPPMVIITVALYMPVLGAKAVHTFMFGNPFRRDMTTGYQRNMFYRDARIGGGLPWNTQGLENIPDEPKNE